MKVFAIRVSLSKPEETVHPNFELGGQGSIPDRGRDFLYPQPPDRLWSSFSFVSNAYRGVKRPGSEADHSPQYSAAFFILFVRLLAMRPLLACCASLG
jgi:hypothetical protein